MISFKIRYLALALAALLLCLLLARMPISRQLLIISDLRIYDTIVDFHNAFLTSSAEGVYDDICIVDIDEKSIAALGQYSSWPSMFFADVVNNLAIDQPLAIGFDVFFTESDSIKGYARNRWLQELSDLPGNKNHLLDRISTDAAFRQAISDAANVYLAMFNSIDVPSQQAIPSKLYSWDLTPRRILPLKYPYPPIPEFSEAAYGIGFAHIEPDESDLIHDYPLFLGLNNRYYVNFSFQLCLDLLGIDKIEGGKSYSLYNGDNLLRKLPLSPDGRFFFKYYGPQKSFRYIPFSDVLQKRTPPGFFHNRIVLIGSSATGLRDIKTTPLDQNYPGVELHATFIRNILEENYVYWLNPWLINVISIILLLGFMLLIIKAKPLISISVFVLFLILLWVGFFLLYSYASYSLSYTSILLPVFLGFMAMFITKAHELNLEKRKVRNAFEHYVSKDVIAQIMKGSQSLVAGGEKKTVSIMFVDVRDFTSLCERLSPAEITSFMNNYFDLATDVITANRGLLDKYIGDAILGLFGAPVEYSDFEFHAVRAGITIRDLSYDLHREYSSHPVLCDFRIGVGIATGELIVGNVGSKTIFNYTGIGDKMNFCSRIEALNKVYRTSIIIDENTFQKVQDRVLCRKLDKVTVKGKAQAHDIYEVIDLRERLDLDGSALSFYNHYETALALMHSLHYQEAKEAIKQALKLNPDDHPSQIMLERIEMVNWETWDGVWHFENK